MLYLWYLWKWKQFHYWFSGEITLLLSIWDDLYPAQFQFLSSFYKKQKQMWTIISLFVICMQVLWSFKEPGAASLPPITGLDLVHRAQMVRIYLMIHDTWVPLQRCCLESLWSVRYFSGLNSRIQTVRGRWGRRTWWGSWSVTRAAVVHQQKAGNHGNDDDATNPLALQGHVKHQKDKSQHHARAWFSQFRTDTATSLRMKSAPLVRIVFRSFFLFD